MTEPSSDAGHRHDRGDDPGGNGGTGGDDGRPGSTSARSRGPFGPLELLDDVQRQAFDAAMRVVGEMSALGGDLPTASWLGDAFDSARDASGAATGGDPATRAAALDVGRLRSDAARAAETFSELMRAMLDMGFDAIDELARRPGPSASGSAPTTGVARIRCIVQNGSREAVRAVRPHVPQLTSGTGDTLHAAVSVEPAVLDLEPYERAAVEVEVVFGERARPGRYHGLLLVAGLRDVALPIVVDVVDTPGADRDGG
jgi:hypothetical protein